MAKVIQDIGERPLVLHSDVQEPLDRMSFLQRALVLAELAMISYNDEAEARTAADAIGFDDAELFRQRRLANLSISQPQRLCRHVPRHRAQRMERPQGGRERFDGRARDHRRSA